jgi:phosphatidylglycerol:prolipoprotein diacylglycerol transferase
VADSFLYGLTAGLAIGRIGCYAVGEHFGRETDFFLGTRYEGGDVREPMLGIIPLEEGVVFHNTALYEFMHLVLLFVLLTVLRWRGASTGTMAGVFCLWYGIARFYTDFLRVNDDTVLGLTGAQFLSLILVVTGLWILMRVRPRLAGVAVEDEAEDELDTEDDGEPSEEPVPEVEVESEATPVEDPDSRK